MTMRSGFSRDGGRVSQGRRALRPNRPDTLWTGMGGGVGGGGGGETATNLVN